MRTEHGARWEVPGPGVWETRGWVGRAAGAGRGVTWPAPAECPECARLMREGWSEAGALTAAAYSAFDRHAAEPHRR